MIKINAILFRLSGSQNIQLFPSFLDLLPKQELHIRKRTMMFPRLHLSVFFLIFAVTAAVVAGQSNDFQCGNPESAQAIMDNEDTSYNTIRVGWICECHNHELVPEEIHWHIYSLPAGSIPRHSIYPPGLVKPKVSGSVLSYELQNILETKGEEVQAGINLYIPVDKLQIIQIDGVNQFVEVKAGSNDTITNLSIVDSGVDNQVLLSMPNWIVDYEEMGVGNNIQMDVAAGSSISISGVDIEANVKCPEKLTVRTTGVDNNVFIEGQLLSAVMDGVDGEIKVNDKGQNNPCGNVQNDGIANDCHASEYIFAMDSLSCLAETEADYQCSSFWPYSTAASVGFGVGLLLFIIAMIAACIFCFCVSCRKKTRQTDFVKPPSQHESNKAIPEALNQANGEETDASVVEAEVIEIKSTTTGVIERGTADGDYVDIEKEKNETVAAT
jgi:hypothetical protein